jgi:hypothetical protein
VDAAFLCTFLVRGSSNALSFPVPCRKIIVNEKGAISMLKTYEGGCHCGRVRFRATGDLSRVTACNCSMCTMKGLLHMIVAQDQFELLSGADHLTTYTFNTHVAKHTFCKTCGMHPFYVPRSNPDMIDVNVRCLDGVDLSAIEPMQFDGKNWESAFAEKEHRL